MGFTEPATSSLDDVPLSALYTYAPGTHLAYHTVLSATRVVFLRTRMPENGNGLFWS
jgi:hypothetical protein